MGLSRYLIREVTKYYFGKRAAWSYPALYLGLFTTLPAGPDDAGTEVGAAGYARQLTVDGVDWTLNYVAELPRVVSTRSRYFGPAGAPWTVTGFGLWDASSGGNLLIYGRLTAALSVAAGRGAHIPAGACVIEVTTWLTGPLTALLYAMPGSVGGSPAYYRPDAWRLYPLIALPTYDDYNAGFPRNFPEGLLIDAAPYASVGNTATDWPLVGADVTNAAALALNASAQQDWPDVTALLVRAVWNAGYFSHYWVAPLPLAATVRQGERLEIAAGAVQFTEL